MNFIKNLTYKKSLIIFIGCLIVNFSVSFVLFNFYNLPNAVAEYKKIAEFFLNQVKTKNIELNISKNGISLNQNSFLIESKDFPIELNYKNLIYISKKADYSDFKNQETFAILNDKEFVLNMNNTYQNFPLNSLNLGTDNLKIDVNFVESSIDKFFNQTNGVRNYLISAFLIEKVIFYIAQFFWGYLMLFWAVFYTLKFSGYSTVKESVRMLTISYFGLYLIFEPAIVFFKFPVQIVEVFLIGYLALTFYLKSKLEKLAKTEADH